MFKLVRDSSIRSKAANYLKHFRNEKRYLATNQEVVPSADVVIIGKSNKICLFLEFILRFLFGIYQNTSKKELSLYRY